MATSNFHETVEGRSAGEYLQFHSRDFQIYGQSKDVADYQNLQRKVEFSSLNENFLHYNCCIKFKPPYTLFTLVISVLD